MSVTCTYFTKGMESYKLNNKIYNLIDRSPILAYDPKSFDFGNMYEGEENSTTFNIWNSGCCILYYSFDWNCSWVDVYPTSGYCITENDTIDININTTGLLTGPNLCNITILSNGGNGYFIVTVNIIHCQIVNITVNEAWELLNSTDNGIQIPIDVRTDEEWKIEHIDTPIPENPRHHPLDDLKNETKLNEFLSMYKYQTIVVYDNAGVNSYIAAQILYDNNFKGSILNMNDGINGWKDAGYPVKSNSPPEKPIITGPTNIKIGVEYTYTFVASDPDQDYIFYQIHWGDTKVDTIGPYVSGEIVKYGHTWNHYGNYSIGTIVIDRYNAVSDWGFLNIKVPINKILFQNFCLFKQLLIILNKFININ